MKIAPLFMIMLMMCYACDEKPAEPVSIATVDNISILGMSVDSVVPILADMHYAHEAAKVNRQVKSDSLKMVYEDQVLGVYEMSRSTYEALKSALESDLNLYYAVEQKVHEYLKSLREDGKK